MLLDVELKKPEEQDTLFKPSISLTEQIETEKRVLNPHRPTQKLKKKKGNRERPNVVVPAKTADWFDMDEIADVEKDSLPEFFLGIYPSKTPTVYKEYRNFMIHLYRMNTQTFITATSKSHHSNSCRFPHLWGACSLQKTLVGRCLCYRQSARLPL